MALHCLHIPHPVIGLGHCTLGHHQEMSDLKVKVDFLKID